MKALKCILIWMGVVSALLFSIFSCIGLVISAIYAPHSLYCNGSVYRSEEPKILILPDLRNLSMSENNSLLAGSYEVSSKYSLKMETISGFISLCIVERNFTRVSACLEIGSDVEQVVICGPDLRPDCLPSATASHYFGVSIWSQNDSTVVYTIVDIDTNSLLRKDITNTTSTLSSVWYELLNCQIEVNFILTALLSFVIGILLISMNIFISLCCCIRYISSQNERICHAELRRRERGEEGEGIDERGQLRLSRTFIPPPISEISSHQGVTGPDEVALRDLCWIPFGISKVRIEHGTLCLQPSNVVLKGREKTITMEVPREAVATIANVYMRYAIIPDGSFALPEGYQFGSMVVYIYYDGSLVNLPLRLHLPHWYGGEVEDHVKDGMSFVIAPHYLKTRQRVFHFELVRGGTFSKSHGIFDIDGHSSLFAIAFKKKATSVYLATQWDRRLAAETRTKIVITYFTEVWLEILAKYWESWRVNEDTYVSFRFALLRGSVCGKLSESKAEEWTATLEGANTVHQDDVVFHNRYTKDELKRKVASKLYPPAIQYAVIYRTPPDFDKAASRVRVLEVIISGTDREQFSFPIKVYETVKPALPPPTLNPTQAEATPQAGISQQAAAASPPSLTLAPAQAEASSQPTRISVWEAAAILQTPASTTQSVNAGNAIELLERLPSSASEGLAQSTPTGTTVHLSGRLSLDRVTSSPLDPLHQKPILRDLNNKVVVRVAGKWETTGLELDIEDYVLQAIKTPNGSNEFHCREMFRRWLARAQGCGALPRTWSSVLDAVERSCGTEVSRELRELIHQSP